MSRILFILKALGPGERWITVHPHGKEHKGQPVLIRENPDGTATVIGGAGGKLNYLKLRGVKSEAQYKQEAADRQKRKREQRKEQREREKAAGTYEAKKQARESLKAQQRAHERSFIRTVAEAMGWRDDEIEFDASQYEHLSEAALNRLAMKHHRDLLKRAHAVVDAQRKRLVEDTDARMQAGLAEVPLESEDAEQLSVADLDPVKPNGTGLGYATDYKGRAEAAGLTEEELQREAGELREQKLAQMTDSQRRAAIKRGETAKMLREELASVREPALPDARQALADARQAVELLKAQKRLRAIQQQARAARKQIDAEAEPKAFVLEYTADPELEEQLSSELENDLRTLRTRAFLDEVGRLAGGKPEETLGRHIGVGAYNSINALALVAGGEAMVDRSVVDVLGVAGAAQVLARRLANDLSAEEYEQLAEGMQDFHLHHYMQTSEKALEQAKALHDEAAAIELDEAANGGDLEVMQALNARRREAIGQAQKLLGQALGEMEANAALTVALKQGKKDQVQVPLGNLSPEDAVRQARAIGLQRGDYSIETVGGNRFLTVNAAGMDRLAKPVDRESLQQIRRNLDIIEGRHDEDSWLPLGIANRPDLAMDIEPGVAPRLAQPFEPGEDLEQSLRDYIGGRTADGDPPADILADIQSAEFFQKVGFDRAEEYRAALDAVAPLKGADGKLQRAESLAPSFERYAEEFTERHYGGKLAPLHRQQVNIDQTAVDALHRALSDHPEGTAAFKPIGDLTPQDRRALREHFYKHIAKESPEAAALRQELEELEAAEPERETTDMFGETAVNPEWTAWRNRRDDLATTLNASTLTWSKYVDAMRGHEKAYEAVQDLIRSNVAKAFADHHNRLNPKVPLKVGRTVIRNNLNHLDTIDPEAREARLAQERALIDSLRERVQGRYASGSVRDKLDAAREQREAFSQAQMGFFADHPAPEADKPLGKDERYTLGHAAERQLAGMMGIVGKNFKPGQPIKLWQPSMNGKGIARQRAVKLIEANKRVVLSFGVGSGKTLIGLAGFTHLQQQGKAKRGLFLVPSIVQGQFQGEALRYLEPGKFNWHIEPGASREERIRAYKNPEHHFAVMTHQAFRDDMIHLGAKHAGISEDQMRERLAAMQPAERRAWMKEVLDKEGISFDYLMVDEGHDLLNRAGKENSAMANVVDAFSAHTPYYVSASGDPIKNDPSEAFDLLSKMDPERYTDRAAFMRRYGVDTIAAKDALRREMARYVYPSRIDPDVTAERRQVKTVLSDGQRRALDDLNRHVANARLARMQGTVDVEAMRAISPGSFDGVPAEQHENVARELQKNLGILREAATHRIIYAHPDNPLMDAVVEHAAQRRGTPGVVFAHSLEAVQHLKERLERAGHRVVAITGADSAKAKEAKRQQFNPEKGEPSADILVVSDAGATGMNIQRGQWLFQYDTPMTAKTHAQRNGRIFRTGQLNNVELIDGVPDHPVVRRARERLARKYELREMLTTPLEGLDDSGLAYFLKKRQTDAEQGGLF